MDGASDAGLETLPVLCAVDKSAPTEVAIQLPFAVLLENGPDFSTVFANRISIHPETRETTIEDCTQFKLLSDGHCIYRKFTEVTFSKDPRLPYFLASPDGGDSFFSQPSIRPYVVVEFSPDEAVRIEAALEKSSDEFIFELLRNRFTAFAGFSSPNSLELHSPEAYACGREAYPNQQVFL